MSDQHLLDGFPPFKPIYKDDDIASLNREMDEAWNKAFREAWTSWGHRLVPKEKPDWVHWASRLYTNKRTEELYNHLVGKAAAGLANSKITWGNIAAVLSNPRWTKESIMKGAGLDWAKRAQKQFPNADIFQGQPNDNGPAIPTTVLSSTKRTSRQATNDGRSPQSSPTATSNASTPSKQADEVHQRLDKYKKLVLTYESDLKKLRAESKEKQRALSQEATLAKVERNRLNNKIEKLEEAKKKSDASLNKERLNVLGQMDIVKDTNAKNKALEAEVQLLKKALATPQGEYAEAYHLMVESLTGNLETAKSRLRELGQAAVRNGTMTSEELNKLMELDE
ncbi:hypothetical protein FNAPI_1136 [Fusarium napiforme]|uniref:Uncharacterized protein n=1 Tax=Fusarium napiforme TaxID=42672 RepID=A0A8H5K5R5_9HYPO|nr:hypothetical protein FNAPI_1136 [Fusarium napiforme]